MILTGEFFSMHTLEKGDGMVKAALLWNAEHPIFQGHFPGQPVVPGVCMIQLIQETLEQALDKEVVLVSSSQVKFLHVIDPRQFPSTDLLLQYSVNENGTYQVSSTLMKETTSFMKMNAVFSSPTLIK
jgi:3-hydroxyacyl-[acyl-carrier-protein] dehydratase